MPPTSHDTEESSPSPNPANRSVNGDALIHPDTEGSESTVGNRLLSEGILVVLATAAVYAGAFVHEASFLSTFEAPISAIQLGWPVLIKNTLLLIASTALFLGYAYLNDWFGDVRTRFLSRSFERRPVLTSLAVAAWLYLARQLLESSHQIASDVLFLIVWASLFLSMLLAGVFLFFFLLRLGLRFASVIAPYFVALIKTMLRLVGRRSGHGERSLHGDERLGKNSESAASENLPEGTDSRSLPKTKRKSLVHPVELVFLLGLYLLVAMFVGAATASVKTGYYITSDDEIVLRAYGDRLITAKRDAETGYLVKRFRIVPMPSEDLRLEYEADLHPNGESGWEVARRLIEMIEDETSAPREQDAQVGQEDDEVGPADAE